LSINNKQKKERKSQVLIKTKNPKTIGFQKLSNLLGKFSLKFKS